MSWERRIPEVRRRHGSLTQRLTDPAVLGDREKLPEVAREHA